MSGNYMVEFGFLDGCPHSGADDPKTLSLRQYNLLITLLEAMRGATDWPRLPRKEIARRYGRCLETTSDVIRELEERHILEVEKPSYTGCWKPEMAWSIYRIRHPDDWLSKNAVLYARLLRDDAGFLKREAEGEEDGGSHISADTEFLTVEDVAGFLKVPKTWVWQRTRGYSGTTRTPFPDRLPGFKVGKYWRFRRSEVLQWLEQHRVNTEAAA